MSVVGFSSYFLWTEKGKTVLPLIRGSAFILDYHNTSAFNKRHVITAAHCAIPTRFPNIFSNNKRLAHLGERHIYTKALMPRFLLNSRDEQDYTIGSMSFLRNNAAVFPHVDVCSMRLREESVGDQWGLQGFEIDTDALQDGDEVVYIGLHAQEEKANPTDDHLQMHPLEIGGVCRAAYLSGDYGMVMLGTASEPVPLSMCGGPVLRRSNMKVVGVIVAQVRQAAPPSDPRTELIYHDPWLDISAQPDLCQIPDLQVAFVPLGEFYHALRKSET
jgi:hypothetical protein